MPRQSTLDHNEALGRAMAVFWQNGYGGSSIEDLVNATGLSRHGIYGAFESKQGLFRACLARYVETVIRPMFASVEAVDASLPEIRAYFQKLLSFAPTEAGRRGCMMVNTGNELAGRDDHATEAVKAFRTRLQKGFLSALTTAKRKGELSSAADVEELSDFLVGIVQGLSMLARSHADVLLMAHLVKVTFASLR